MMRIILSLLMLIASSSYCFSGTRDPNVPDSKYIEYGAKADCVVRLCAKDSKGQLACGSGVVIDKHWVITAAHVVHGSESCIITVKDKKYCIDKMISHKDFNDDNFGYYDIALGYIKDGVDLEFYPELYREKNEISKTAYIAGYGLTGTFSTGATLSDGKKRAGTNKIDYIDRHLLVCGIGSTMFNPKTELEFLIASGDSGGGLFIDQKLAGINSCVMASDKKPDSNYGDDSGHTRVSIHIDWIEEVMNNEKE